MRYACDAGKDAQLEDIRKREKRAKEEPGRGGGAREGGCGALSRVAKLPTLCCQSAPG